MRATRALIHLDHLRNNIRAVKQHIRQGLKICMAVKADAYGHGAVEVAKIAVSEGINYLGIATLQEGVELRQAGISIPLLLLGLTIPDEIPTLVENRIFPLVADEVLILAFAKAAARQAVKLEVHLKVDTGMGRIGCPPGDTVSLARLISRNPSLILGGICTHFPGADLKDKSFTLRQLAQFTRIIAAVKEAGINPGLVHAANSGAVIDLPESCFTMVRPGIMFYGYYPSTEQKRILPLQPVMEFKSKIVYLKNVAPGTSISYGMTYTTAKATTIATLPVGYADGYNRLLSNSGEVLIKNERYPVAGRICMDQCMIDLNLNRSIKLYEDVILFGPRKQGPDAEEIAAKIGTIPYEVTCMVGKRVPRIYLP